jgi:hypothetical protein
MHRSQWQGSQRLAKPTRRRVRLIVLAPQPMLRVYATCLVSALVILCATAASALAAPHPICARNCPTTIDFETPVIPGSDSPQIGPQLTDQYQSDGIVFVPATSGTVPDPVGFVGPEAGTYLYRDDANAHSGTQVLRAYDVFDEGEAADAWFLAELTTETTSVSLYAGAQPGSIGGGNEASPTVELVGYDADGNEVPGAVDTATVGEQDDTLLKITSSTADIAYFSVDVPDGTTATTPQLEVDDVTYIVPSAPPPPLIRDLSVSEVFSYPTGIPTASVSVERLNAENDPIDLQVSGLPSGVTVTGGTTIAPGSDSTTLQFAVAADAPLGSVPFTVSATAADVSGGPLQAQSGFTIQAPFTSTAAPAKLDVQPCSSATGAITTRLGGGFQLSGPVNLSLAASGDTADLGSLGLATTTLQPSDFVGGSNDDPLTVHRNDRPGSPFEVTVTPSSGSFTEPATSLEVDPSPPDISSVNTQLYNTTGVIADETPNPSFPDGMGVHIHGDGFCPNSTVEFGNKFAVVPATVSNNGHDIGVQTPLLATSGSLTVTSGGQTATAAQPLDVDSYRNVDGYSFHNYTPNLTWGQMRDAFGVSQTYWNIDACPPFGCTVASYPNPIAEAVLAVAQNTLGGSNGGACFGFALSTQRFLMGQESTYQFTGTSDPFFGRTIFGLGESGPLVEFINASALQQFSGDLFFPWLAASIGQGAESGATASEQFYNEIKAVFLEDHYPMIELQDGGGHVVVAYNVQGSPPGPWVIDVYDSNLPFNDIGDENAPDGEQHHLNFASSRIAVQPNGRWSLSSTSMSGGPTELVVTDPASIGSPPSLIGNISIPALAGDTAVASTGRGAHSPEHGTTTQATGAGSSGSVLFSTGVADLDGGQDRSPAHSTVTQVSDSAGRTLYNANGSLNTDRATRLAAAPYFPPVAGTTPSAGAADQKAPIIVASGEPSLDLAIRGDAAGADTHTVIGRGYLAQASTQITAGEVDHATLGADGASISTGAATQPVKLSLVDVSRAADRVAVVTTPAVRGAGDKLAFAAAGAGIEFTHTGPPTAVDLTLSSSGNDQTPETFETGPLDVASGAQVKIGSIHWNGLSGAAVAVTVDGHTSMVRNHIRTVALATIAAVKVGKPRAGSVVLTIVRRANRLPAGAQLTFSWVVRLRARTVARDSAFEPASARSASFTFRSAAGKKVYTVIGRVAVSTISGLTEAGSSSAVKRSFRG